MCHLFQHVDSPCLCFQDEDQLVISSILPWVECGDQSTRRWVHTAMANGPKRWIPRKREPTQTTR
jgi:hypothetical protein